jgi:hypothetical protein
MLTYPAIIDRAVLHAARVEARLRLAAGRPDDEDRLAATSFFVTGK